MNSKHSNQPMNGFPVSSDRFSRTTMKTPDPGKYDPRNNFNQNVKSQFKYRGSTRFGQDRRTFIDQMWMPTDRATTPAPGAYESFSDFAGFSSRRMQ